MGRIFDKDGLNCIEPPATTPTPRLVSTLSFVQLLSSAKHGLDRTWTKSFGWRSGEENDDELR